MLADNIFSETAFLPSSPKFPGGLDSLYTFLNANVELPAELQGAKATGHNYFTIILDSDGKVINVNHHIYIKTYADKQIEQALLASPAWRMPASAIRGTFKTVYMPINIKWIAEPSLIPATVKAKYAEGNRINYASFALSKYVLLPSQLGWINCDRFINTIRNTDLLVQFPSSTDYQAKLLFHSIKSLYDGIKTDNGVAFRNVPLDAEVTVVAMKCENEKFYIATHAFITTRNSKITNLKFKEVNQTELAAVFKKLANPEEEFALK
jgi:hypothetical protein